MVLCRCFVDSEEFGQHAFGEELERPVAERSAEQVFQAHFLAEGLQLVDHLFRGSLDRHPVEVTLDGIG